jgi:hypothetical protein
MIARSFQNYYGWICLPALSVSVKFGRAWCEPYEALHVTPLHQNRKPRLLSPPFVSQLTLSTDRRANARGLFLDPLET